MDKPFLGLYDNKENRMRIKFWLIFVVGISINTFSGCVLNKAQLPKEYYENDYVRIQGVRTIQANKKSAALVNVDGDEIFVEELTSVDSLPVNIEARFFQTFRAYHYHKFFELIHVDPKVQPLFRDSVKVLEVLPSTAKVDARELFECKPCNAKAVLQFRYRKFVYPATIPQAWLEESAAYDISHSPSQSLYPGVRYTGTDPTLPSGIYMKLESRKFLHIYGKKTSSSVLKTLSGIQLISKDL